MIIELGLASEATKGGGSGFNEVSLIGQTPCAPRVSAPEPNTVNPLC